MFFGDVMEMYDVGWGWGCLWFVLGLGLGLDMMVYVVGPVL